MLSSFNPQSTPARRDNDAAQVSCVRFVMDVVYIQMLDFRNGE
jgi:hypothetical protein